MKKNLLQKIGGIAKKSRPKGKLTGNINNISIKL